MPDQGAPKQDFQALRPARCPCCGAGLTEDRNSKGKYRLFRYECGASGWHHERIGRDNAVFADKPLWTGEIEWENACPDAMSYVVNSRARSEAGSEIEVAA